MLAGPQAALLAAATHPDPDERPALTDLARAVVGGTGRTGPATTVVLPQVAESGAAEPKVRTTPPVERRALRRWVPAVAGATALAIALGGYAAATRLGLLGSPAPGPAPTAGAAGSPQATAPSVVTTVPGSVVPSVATPSSTDSSTASLRCMPGKVTLAATQRQALPGGGVQLRLTVTNTSKAACTLTGWPGVSLVGGDNGDQIGQPGDRAGGPARTITVRPGGTAAAAVTIASTASSPSCAVRPARGLRVYLPDTSSALFVAVSGLSGCGDPGSPPLIAVSPFA
ncbi:MAG TPA: DUF4232 domain-containing protein [Dermatophilaceae bacterium]|nr:DUF4232 domain-containing protein [Dermatophilaceae bacterium]